LDQCREAVPAWVMPLHRVWDTVAAVPGMFDVIIVDEASQCGLEALPLLYLGKKILIVGDDKQISPEAVGVDREAVQQLKKELIYDFEFDSTFDVENSLFDHGRLRYGEGKITLREHFRCMPEIIRFSNNLSYADTPLIPLRQHGRHRIPPLESRFVKGGYREGTGSRTINRPEADAIVEEVVRICGDDQYDGKWIGVVVLQGEAQALVIEQNLLERLGAEEMERRRLICGNPYSFQGDERHVILLSMVAANDDRPLGVLSRENDQRRFNVAASRARDRMVLFHSVRSADLSKLCLRRRMLEFFEDPRDRSVGGLNQEDLERQALEANRSVENPPKPFDSWFEVDVALEIVRRGFSVLPQYEVAGRRIDLVVEGGDARLAVECDGDHWHGLDHFEADMVRQRQLERCGWEFFRVMESAFRLDKAAALSELWRSLREREIRPRNSNVELEEPALPVPSADKEAAQEEVAPDQDGSPQPSRSPEHEGDDSGSAALDKVSATEIGEAITRVLQRCPNNSCTMHSLTARVLKDLGILTRGRPRKRFENRVLHTVSNLEKRDKVEKYKAKNQRLRLRR